MSEKVWLEHFKQLSAGNIPRQQGYYVVENYKSPKASVKKSKAKKRKHEQLS